MKKFKKLIIACDGESASGKSTAAKLISENLVYYQLTQVFYTDIQVNQLLIINLRIRWSFKKNLKIYPKKNFKIKITFRKNQ